MNQRIKELAEQAGLEFDGDEALEFGKQIYYVTKEDMEKFAELIVRECSNMAESFHRHQYDFTGDLELHEFMKKHFGVKE